MEKEIKQEKELVLKRVPPGDRWVFATTPRGTIYPSLTVIWGRLKHLL